MEEQSGSLEFASYRKEKSKMTATFVSMYDGMMKWLKFSEVGGLKGPSSLVFLGSLRRGEFSFLCRSVCLSFHSSSY